MVTMLIKGDRFAAAAACLHHRIMHAEFIRYLEDTGDSIVATPLDYLPYVRAWLYEEPRPCPVHGFPTGTLLFYAFPGQLRLQA